MCRQAAPDLVQVYSKYKNRQVAFVSLTGDSRSHVEDFVKKLSIPWPSGYHATRRMLDSLAAIRQNATNTGYGMVAPTLYLVRPDGTILWNDGRLRYQHQPTKVLARKLEQALDKALRAPRL